MEKMHSHITNSGSSTIMTDEQLLEQIKRGNTQVFEEIYHRWKKKIYSYVMTLLNYNKEDAEQILGDIFIALFEYNKEHLIRNSKTFLYTTAHNKAIDLMKKKSEEYGDNLLRRNETDVNDMQRKEDIHLSYKQDLMKKYLTMLQPREKEIVHLFFYEEKSYEEIAQILGTNKNTIGTILLQAKKKLKEFVQRENTQDILVE